MTSEIHRGTAQAINEQQSAIAGLIVDRVYELNPQLELRYGPAGRSKCVQDTIYHLKYLSEALALDSPMLFADYLSWAKILLAAYRIPMRDLEDNVRAMAEVLNRHLPAASGKIAIDCIEKGLNHLQSAPEVVPSFISDQNPHASKAREYLEALLIGNRFRASEIVTDIVQKGGDVRDVYLHIFAPTQYEIGRLWQAGKLSVAQEHFSCTAATQMIMSRMYPLMFNSKKNGKKIVAASVAGESHEIGVRMVADFLEMEGWDTFYVGANTPAASLVKLLEQHQADLLGISATMTFHINAVVSLIGEVRKSEFGRKVKIIVGGYPFNLDRELWRKVGADAYAASVKEIHLVATRLLA